VGKVKAVVIGGGMSGLATAINLLDLGLEVSLYEADEIFGGRASSWIDEDGDTVDNALHVFMPYYVNLLNFFDKLGISENIIWKDTSFYYAMKGGRQAVLKFAPLPPPGHAIYAFLHLLKDFDEVPRWKVLASLLPLGIGVLRGLLNLDRLDEISMESLLCRYTFYDAMRPLMEPAIRGLTFSLPYEVSAKVMVNWFTKMFVSAKNSRIGFANGGLGDIWVDNCLKYIRERGGEAWKNKRLSALEVRGLEVKSALTEDGEKLEADIFVSAIDPHSLLRILPAEALGFEYFRQLVHFKMAPSMSLQIWFDRKLTDIDCTFFSNGCIFNTYADLSNVIPHVFKGGSMFELVISPADYLLGLSDKVIFDQAYKQFLEIFPEAKNAEVNKWKLVRVRQGVYRPFPGMERYRPFQRTPFLNFYLAGDYTKTPVSSGGMEAAIWTANRVAELIAMDRLGKSLSLNVDYRPYEIMMNSLRPILLGQTALLALFAARLVRKVFSRSD